MIHAKTWIIDGNEAIVGSHNLTIAGLTKNLDISITTNDPRVVSELKNVYDNAWKTAQPFAIPNA